MGFRTRSATPGTLLCLVATILLAVVSFNTPLLKSLYFLEARFSSGQYAGTLRLGTLGYCLDVQGSESCVGPTVGYNFNPNTIFNISAFNIPEAVAKYLTYALILHVVALAFAAGGTIFGLLSHISTLSLLCFPTCTASLASTFSLLAFIFDVAIFYIAKSRIDSVDGASATIGISVWLTLAAWLCAGFSGCAYGIGRCCVGARRNDRSGGDNNGNNKYNSYANPGAGAGGPDDMRLHAIRDEQIRKQNQKEQGLPSFSELERQPLTAGGGMDKDEYVTYQDGVASMPGAMPQGQGRNGLARDGSVLNGVGVGYGRRTPRDEQGMSGHALGYGGAAVLGAGAAAGLGAGAGAGYAQSVVSSAGAAGVGAGGAGVERASNNYYNDPYAQASPNEQAYNQDPYGRAQTYSPGPNSYSEASYRPEHAVNANNNATIPEGHEGLEDPNQSMDSHYGAQHGQVQPNPSARVDPYDAYGGYEHGRGSGDGYGYGTERDQGLSGIGMAAAGVAAGAAAGHYAGAGHGQQQHQYPPQQSRSPDYGNQYGQQQQQQQYDDYNRQSTRTALTPINTQPSMGMGMGGFGTYGSQLNSHGDPYRQQSPSAVQQQQHYPPQGTSQSQSHGQIHQPQPQHLAGLNSFTGQPDILRSPVSEVSSLSQYPSTQMQQHAQVPNHSQTQYAQQAQQAQQLQQGGQEAHSAQGYAHLAPASAAAHGYGGQQAQEQLRDDGYQGGVPVDRPPSYGTVPGATSGGGYRAQPEKSQYQAR